MPKLCEFENCRKQASYGEYHNKPIRCKEHKEDYKIVGMICRKENCSFYGNFGYEETNKKLYCSLHKLENMVSLSNCICEYEGCKVSASCNFPGLKAKYCAKHKLENMIISRGIYCKITNCKKLATHNYLNEKEVIYCAEHKLENMVNIKNKKCCIDNCNLMPSFNFINTNIALYCDKHKLDNIINIKSKKCCYEDCQKRPNYNYKNEKVGIYCYKHKLENMVDVQHKICEENECNTRATYNYKSLSPIYCSKHKKENMINVADKVCKANFCLGSLGRSNYKGYCISCFKHLFPTDPLTLQSNCKTKEDVVKNYININFEGFHHDKPLWTGNCDCTHRRRIDHRKLIGNTLLCIETDENQHKNYNKVDEEIRYDDLYMIHGGKFIFIRFNPDKYTNKDGNSVNPFLYTRLPILKEEIEKQISRIEKEENTELLEIIKLYYNEYN